MSSKYNKKFFSNIKAMKCEGRLFTFYFKTGSVLQALAPNDDEKQEILEQAAKYASAVGEDDFNRCFEKYEQ